MPTEKFKKPRKQIKAKINRYRSEDIDTLADLEFEDRSTKTPHEKNRYDQIIDVKKEEKRKIQEKKLEKFWIKNKKHIRKRAEVEAEIENETDLSETV